MYRYRKTKILDSKRVTKKRESNKSNANDTEINN